MQPALAPAPHPSMQSSAQDHADQVLHDQLLAAQQHLSPHPQPGRPQQPVSHPPHMQPQPAGPRDQNNIDPAIAGAAMLSTPTEAPQPTTEAPPQEGRKTYGKRELSTSKRAAQNRAAQRAFRQRKEGYIRKLEEQVKDYEVLSENYKALQAENYQLREYIISLQSRLIDSQNEVPELPGNIDLSQPRPEPPTAPTAGTAPGVAPAAAPGSVPGAAPAPAPGAAPASTPVTSASVPTPGAPATSAPHQGPPSTAPSSAPGEDLNSLNRIAVAGLGMRKHPHEESQYLANNFPQKRMRSDEGESESSSAKTDVPNGLPVVT